MNTIKNVVSYFGLLVSKSRSSDSPDKLTTLVYRKGKSISQVEMTIFGSPYRAATLNNFWLARSELVIIIPQALFEILAKIGFEGFKTGIYHLKFGKLAAIKKT